MEKAKENKHTPHCLILPFPTQSHINPMIQFSKRLADRGIRVTLAATKYLLKNMQELSSSISVDTISDGFDEGGVDYVRQLGAYLDRFGHVGPESLSDLLNKLENSGCPVDCVIYDPFLPWALVVARRFELLGAAFFTQPNFVNIVFYNVHKKQLKVPILEKEILLPGLPSLEISDMPSFVRDREKHPGSLEMHVNQFLRIEDADFVLVNSVYELEEEATDWFKKLLPVKTIGPTTPSMYLDKRLPKDKNYGLSMVKPDNSCMKWLEQRAPKSVIYVSFGSLVKVEKEQMEELAQALKLTDRYFLWVVRSSEESKLPKDFAQKTSEKGLIVSWCPQVEVLSHDTISCFVTHCGWNSMLEALSLGVPMVGMPWWADQSTNAKFMMDVWKVGIRTCPDGKNIVRHQEISRCIKYVMDGERGEDMRNNSRQWNDMIREAVDEGGSSDINIQEFVSTIIRAGPQK